MDIIQQLCQDHTKMRKELVNMRHCLDHARLRDHIKEFVSSHELHESVEEDLLFPLVNDQLIAYQNDKLISGYEDMHGNIWKMIEDLMDALVRTRFSDLQQAFFTFAAAVEAHFAYEERVLFPIIRELLGEKKLNELGKKAQSRYYHFSLK